MSCVYRKPTTNIKTKVFCTCASTQFILECCPCSSLSSKWKWKYFAMFKIQNLLKFISIAFWHSMLFHLKCLIFLPTFNALNKIKLLENPTCFYTHTHNLDIYIYSFHPYLERYCPHNVKLRENVRIRWIL